VDKQDNLRLKQQGQAMSDLPSNSEVLKLLDELGEEK